MLRGSCCRDEHKSTRPCCNAWLMAAASSTAPSLAVPTLASWEGAASVTLKKLKREILGCCLASSCFLRSCVARLSRGHGAQKERVILRESTASIQHHRIENTQQSAGITSSTTLATNTTNTAATTITGQHTPGHDQHTTRTRRNNEKS